MAKWAARFALGLSNSVPGIRLDHQNVLFMDDIGMALLFTNELTFHFDLMNYSL